ncbi:hypothetical protein [Prevotella ihumii]|uniref:hypothetical protein n=1 Tax=Prevotella ihumii TaxID=1917878 RepID=UPI00117C78C7|nr:hypothetical protein [Prevotella ihumii]
MLFYIFNPNRSSDLSDWSDLSDTSDGSDDRFGFKNLSFFVAYTVAASLCVGVLTVVQLSLSAQLLHNPYRTT